ncbi:MAG: site-specific integrase [Bdellovibrionales bacterium]|nr:site-specific integrase [Bdellovibrionales bacterium]
MSVRAYPKGETVVWKGYINVRSKVDRTLRITKYTDPCDTKEAAELAKKKLLRWAYSELARQESLGKSWGSIIDRWRDAALDNRVKHSYQRTTIEDHVSRLKKWTELWLKRPASEIGRGDAREVLFLMTAEGKSKGYQEQLKHTVNVVYDWGIEERLILGVNQSPMRGVVIGGPKEEKVPEILTLEEMRKLLFEAKRLDHPWYPVWAMAMSTGMRNGELHALLWSDVDLENRKILVSKSFHSRNKIVKSTKSGRWRTVPIADELLKLLIELKATAGNRPHVLPRHYKWDSGQQAEVLRTFCEGIGIKSVRFHTLRACFATQLLTQNVAQARIMKVCGWSELKTMQKYSRLGGVDERDATKDLKVLPNDVAAVEQVVDLIGFKSAKDAQ